jgi:L-cysteine desulfidase
MDEENVENIEEQAGNETQTWYTQLTRQRTWSIGSMVMQKRKAEESPETDSKAVLKKSTPRTPAIRRRGLKEMGELLDETSLFISENKNVHVGIKNVHVGIKKIIENMQSVFNDMKRTKEEEERLKTAKTVERRTEIERLSKQEEYLEEQVTNNVLGKSIKTYETIGTQTFEGDVA